ncbi:hypothetical protein Tco_1421672 [Tanacetum coccineum]
MSFIIYNNDGYFAYLPLTYVDGVILEIVVPMMPYEQLAEFLEEKCGGYFQGLYYQVPSQDLERGLVRVSDDRSTSYMFDVEETFGRLTLYLDHLDMNLSEYLSQAITYDMDDLIEVETEGGKARTSTTDGVKARNSTTEGVKARTSTKDKRKEKVSEDASDVVETRRCTVEVDSETENRIKDNKKAKAKAKDKPNEEMNEPNDSKQYAVDKVRGAEGHPFIYVEKHVERYPMYDETTHWRLRRPKVVDKLKLGDITDLVMKKYKCKVSPNQCTNAKKYALTEYEKTVGEHYAMLRSYGKAILDSNPGSTVKLGVTVNPDGKTYFNRFDVVVVRLHKKFYNSLGRVSNFCSVV